MMKRIYLDTCVWCRPFDEPSHRVTEEDIMRHYNIKVCAPTEFEESDERKDDI